MKTAQLYDKSRSIAFYQDRYADNYMGDWPAEKKSRVFEVLQSLGLPEHGEALDYGCGAGVFTDVLRQALPPGWTVYGMDISDLAVQSAKARYPDCVFFAAHDEAFARKQFDFLLTHHVLEHVYDLPQVLDDIANRLPPAASMLHILPCGNAGSLEHSLCLLRTNGIDAQLENRFFFEDEGHVRRLTTAQLESAFKERHFSLAREFYSNHYYGAIDWITKYSADFIQKLADPAAAVDAQAAKKLLGWRRILLMLGRMRAFDLNLKERLANKHKNLKNYVAILYRLPQQALATLANTCLERSAAAEWHRKRKARNGSEMYLFFKQFK